MAIGRLAKVNISVPLLPEIELLLSDTINLYHFIKKKMLFGIEMVLKVPGIYQSTMRTEKPAFMELTFF